MRQANGTHLKPRLCDASAVRHWANDAVAILLVERGEPPPAAMWKAHFQHEASHYLVLCGEAPLVGEGLGDEAMASNLARIGGGICQAAPAAVLGIVVAKASSMFGHLVFVRATTVLVVTAAENICAGNFVSTTWVARQHQSQRHLSSPARR
jgi:hypothetical protein